MNSAVIFSRSFFVFLFCSFALSSIARSEELPWKAGTAKAIITPEKQVWLAGYGYEREPEGVGCVAMPMCW